MITIDDIGRAISLQWRVAGKAESHDDWLRWWGGVGSALSGMWSLLLDTGADQETLNEIEFLEDLAREIKYEGWKR